MKRNYATIILASIAVILAIALVAVLVFLKNQPPQERGIQPQVTEIAAMEPDSARWGLNFPNQYASLLQTKVNATDTTYGGSSQFSHLERDPRAGPAVRRLSL